MELIIAIKISRVRSQQVSAISSVCGLEVIGLEVLKTIIMDLPLSIPSKGSDVRTYAIIC